MRRREEEECHDNVVIAYNKGVSCGRNYASQKCENGEIVTFPTFSRCFDEKREIKYGVWSSEDRVWYEKVFPKMYDDAVCVLKGPERRKIPKIVHQIWLGSSLPIKFREMRERWIRIMGSEWKFILWDEVSISMFGLKNIEAYESAGNYGEKSDIARYEILYRMGGVYLDTDMEPYRSLEPIHNRFEFYAGIANTETIELNNALIASVPRHAILKECMKRVRDNHNTAKSNKRLMSMIGNFLPVNSSTTKLLTNENDAMSTITKTGPGMFTRAFMKIVTSSSNVHHVAAFPPSFFYPFPNNKREDVDFDKRNQFQRPESFCTHHWAATWNSKSKSRHEW